MAEPQMEKRGVCKECLEDVPITEGTKVPNHDVWECPKCGHPHAMDEFWEVFTVEVLA